MGVDYVCGAVINIGVVELGLELGLRLGVVEVEGGREEGVVLVGVGRLFLGSLVAGSLDRWLGIAVLYATWVFLSPNGLVPGFLMFLRKFSQQFLSYLDLVFRRFSPDGSKQFSE